MTIKTVHDFQRGGQYQFTLAMSRHPKMGYDMPSETANGSPIPAEINHGRWIVKCPSCAGAELADPDDPRFFCQSCHNADVGGLFIAVQFPSNKDDLEAALMERKSEETRNWLPHETLVDLLAQTLEREV